MKILNFRRMPITVICSICNFKLYSDWDMVISPETIAKKFGYRCPKCRNKLSFAKPIVNVKVNKKNKVHNLTIKYRFTRHLSKSKLKRLL